ncbi:MAG: Asp-tRNA(Asn)/Glu-tRNA(Gln) amidotransferase subunit GatC [Bacillota bacterium]
MADIQSELEKAIETIKIDITLKEREELDRELSKFLQWLKPVLAVDTTGIERVLISHSAVNVLREDSARQGNPAELQESAPDFTGGFYLVPPIIE